MRLIAQGNATLVRMEASFFLSPPTNDIIARWLYLFFARTRKSFVSLTRAVARRLEIMTKTRNQISCFSYFLMSCVLPFRWVYYVRCRPLSCLGFSRGIGSASLSDERRWQWSFPADSGGSKGILSETLQSKHSEWFNGIIIQATLPW